MKRIGKAIVFVPFLLVMGCQSIPSKMLLSPRVFSDDKVKIEYSFGIRAYSIRITNLTDNEVFINIERCSIISVGGETRNLQLVPADSHIPPRANMVLRSNQQVLFSTDLDSQFKGQLIYDRNLISQKEFIRKFAGQHIRLFIPVTISNEETIYDLLLKIEGVDKLE